MAEGDDSPQNFNRGNKISITKLTNDNFLLWKFPITTALEGYGLEFYLEDDPPQKFHTSSESSSSSNRTITTKYKLWKRQDKLISSVLLGSMSEEILSQMISCTSTKEIWSTLQRIFAA